jgi:hypothetical protein
LVAIAAGGSSTFGARRPADGSREALTSTDCTKSRSTGAESALRGVAGQEDEAFAIEGAQGAEVPLVER